MSIRIQLSTPPQMPPAYQAAILRAGGQPVAGYCPMPDLTCQGLLLCGGGDLDPSWYGQKPNGSLAPDPARDCAELSLIWAFLAAGRPIFGVCRGLQVLNVALGGTLCQNLSQDVLPFHRGEEDVYHPLRTAPDSLMEDLYTRHLTVNSAHHQAVDQPGQDLRPTAWAESGFPEVLEHTHLPVLGVQFHPERLPGRLGRSAADGGLLFQWFIAQCRSV